MYISEGRSTDAGTHTRNPKHVIIAKTYVIFSKILCIMTTLGTFKNGRNRQMVLLFRLGLNHSCTCIHTLKLILHNKYKYSRISIEIALSIKLSHSKYNRCLISSNKEKSYRIIISKYNEHLSHIFQPTAT